MSWFGIIFSILAFFAGFIIAQRRMSSEIGSLKEIKEKFSQWYSKLDVVKDDLAKTTQKKAVLDASLKQKQQLLDQLNTQTTDLQEMETQREAIEQSFSELPSKQKAIEDLEENIEELKSELSLYTDMESYVDYGFYPLPTYGEKTKVIY
jgi:chromosome segregation ATPase